MSADYRDYSQKPEDEGDENLLDNLHAPPGRILMSADSLQDALDKMPRKNFCSGPWVDNLSDPPFSRDSLEAMFEKMRNRSNVYAALPLAKTISARTENSGPLPVEDLGIQFWPDWPEIGEWPDVEKGEV